MIDLTNKEENHQKIPPVKGPKGQKEFKPRVRTSVTFTMKAAQARGSLSTTRYGGEGNTKSGRSGEGGDENPGD